MSECPKYEYIYGSASMFSYGECICKLTNEKKSVNDPYVDKVCKTPLGYENCPIYKRYN